MRYSRSSRRVEPQRLKERGVVLGRITSRGAPAPLVITLNLSKELCLYRYCLLPDFCYSGALTCEVFVPKDRFPQLCKPETLKLATNYFWDDQKDNFIPDVLRHQDYLFNLDENLRRLARNLSTGAYRPSPLQEIDVPKTGLSVRPGSSLHIEDHIVAFGIAYLLAPLLDRFLPASVFHFRVRKKGIKPDPKRLFENREPILLRRPNRKRLQTFEDWYEAWPDFVAEAQSLYQEEGFNLMVEADIAAYFENISHPLLADVLRQHAPQQLKLINLLMEMLSTWATQSLSGTRPQRGIPQGNEISSWLGTLFLVQMDVELLRLQRRGMIRYVRYVDDIKVFTKDEKTARSIVFLMNRLLRRLHLNMQSSKTHILREDEIREHLFDEQAEVVNGILDDFPDDPSKITHVRRREVLSEVHQIYKRRLAHQKDLDKKDIRLFKRILTVLTLTRSGMAINLCLKCIWTQPALTEKIAKYLRPWTRYKQVRDALDLALFGDQRLFDTQYLFLLPLLRHSRALRENHRPALLTLGCCSDVHWHVRAEALLTLMMFSLTESDFRRLKRLYDRENSTCVKKVILALFLKAPHRVKRPMFETTIYEPEEETNRFRKYLWALRQSPSHAQKTLRVLGEVERDPARILASLQGALGSRHADTLKQAKQIAEERAQKAASSVEETAFEDVAHGADMLLKDLAKRR